MKSTLVSQNVVAKIDNIVAVTEETAAAAEEVNASIDHQERIYPNGTRLI